MKNILWQFLLFAVLSTQALGFQLTPETNLFPNWSVEETTGSMPTGWSSPHPSHVNAIHLLQATMQGEWGLEFKPTPSPRWASININNLDVGQRYIASANVKVLGDSGFARIFVFDTASKQILESKIVYPEGYESWQKIQIDFEATNSQIRFYVNNSSTTGSSYYDCFRLIKADSVLGEGSFESDNEGWALGRGASVEVTDSLFGEKSLVLTNGPGNELSSASKTIQLGPDDHEKAFKLSYGVSTMPTPDAMMTNYLLYALRWWVEPYDGMVSDIFDCNIETDWLDNPLDTNEITDRNVPDTDGVGAGFVITLTSADMTQTRSLTTPLMRSNTSSFHDRDFHFLVPEWASQMVVVAVNHGSSSIASFDGLRLNADSIAADRYYEDVGAKSNFIEAPLPGSFLAPDDFFELELALKQVADPINPNYGKIIWLGNRTYSGRHIDVWSGVHLKMHPRARLSRTEDPDSPYYFAAGFIRSCNQFRPGSSRFSDIVVEGGIYVSNQRTGNAISLACNRSIVRNMTISTWSRQDENNPDLYNISGMFLFGNDLSIHNNIVRGPTDVDVAEYRFAGFDGIHIWGGSRASIMHNAVHAGDDGIGLFPITQYRVESSIPEEPDFPVYHFNYNITDIEVYNNRLMSHGARVVGVGIPYPRQPERRLTCEVRDIRVRKFWGRCGGGNTCFSFNSIPALPVNNLPDVPIPAAQVSRILVEDGWAEGDFSIESQVPYFNRVKETGLSFQSADVGSFKDIRVRDVTFKKTTTFGLQIAKLSPVGVPNENIDIRDCVFDVDNDEEPADLHMQYWIDQLFVYELNSDILTANLFRGNAGTINPK